MISASAMAAGDVYNKASSHVRMLVARNSDGTLDMVESYAGSNAWRVDYTVRTIGDNSGYTPRRYFYVTGDTGVKPGTADNPIEIVGTELTDNNSTADSAEELIDSYGCAPGTNESGPEVYYSLALEATSTVTVTVSDGYGVDVDPHLLSGLEPASCIARNDVSFTVDKVYPGDYYIVADTWVNGSGDVLDGDYELTVEIAANGRSRVVVLNGGVRTAAAPPPPAR
ncbi:MAG: hypothetical protein HYV63_02055 [Candidatus Schekmanbacteria bacterium]|nr:hypothetical protein [Candidatus Schekmanbacteria bacterium]